MHDSLILLITGFLLTTVAGGALTYLFQQRAWRHHYEVERQDQQHQLALHTFESLSALLDQRLYRMRLIFWAAKRQSLHHTSSTRLDEALSDYRTTLRVWNDNLNRNLALVDTHFGHAARRRLEYDLFAEYAAIGEELDRFVREVSTATASDQIPIRPIGSRLDELSASVYSFNLVMLHRLRGDLHTDAINGHRVRYLRFGHIGDDVAALQAALQHLGLLSSEPDGHFGPMTERAVREFQRSSGLRIDAVVGPATAELLGIELQPRA